MKINANLCTNVSRRDKNELSKLNITDDVKDLIFLQESLFQGKLCYFPLPMQLGEKSPCLPCLESSAFAVQTLCFSTTKSIRDGLLTSVPEQKLAFTLSNKNRWGKRHSLGLF